MKSEGDDTEYPAWQRSRHSSPSAGKPHTWRRAAGHSIDNRMEVCEMQKAETVLSILKQKSKQDESHRYDRIYRNLFNEDFFLRAYQKIHAKQGNMTPGTDGTTIDGFSRKQISQLIELLKWERYQPKPVRRTYIPKKNGKMRPLGIPAFADKLVQEVVRQILEAIYEPIFSDNSHGFRPNRSCHTALYQIKSTCRGTNWVIEGDITGCFDHIDHEILLKILSKKIDDGRFLELIRKFLKAGYLEFNQKYNSLSGTPQGGIISPILANIYLHEFDKFMEGISAEYTKGKQRRPYREYQILQYKRNRAKKKGNQEQADEYLRQMQNIPALDPMDKNYQRVKYVRYADDFVVCIIGSKATANEIKERIAGFMQKELHLELSREKTKITNLSDKRVRFLGYEITKPQENTKQVVDSIGRKKRSVNGTIQLVVPGDVVREKLKPFIKKGKPYQVGARVNLPVIEIISQYNAEIRGLYNYYCLATDVSTKISTFQYYHYFSMIKTIARKEKSSVKKVIQKYGIDVPRKNRTGTMRIVGIRYNTKEGPKTMTYFNDSLKKVSRPAGEISDQFGQVLKGGQLMKRLNSDVCELCGAEHCALEIHHVRKLKDIVKKYRKRGTPMPNWVWLMSYMKRKTLVLCHDCHVNLHNGTL